MSTVESLLADAAQLPVAERIRLIEAIWETLPDGDLPPQSEEWIAEIQRRSAKIDSGSMETVLGSRCRPRRFAEWVGQFHRSRRMDSLSWLRSVSEHSMPKNARVDADFVAFCSAKERPFSEKKATIARLLDTTEH